MLIYISHNLDIPYLAMFSGVGAGNNWGVNLVAFPMFPLIFIFPVMKAY